LQLALGLFPIEIEALVFLGDDVVSDRVLRNLVQVIADEIVNFLILEPSTDERMDFFGRRIEEYHGAAIQERLELAPQDVPIIRDHADSATR
jgi:hypothetical protein